MQLRAMHVVYGLSALLHGALWFGVTQVEARPPLPKPIRITMRDVPPPPPDEPPPPPEPEPEPEAEPPPEAAPIDVPEPAAPPEPSPPKPKRAKPEPAPSQPTPAPDVPDFGLQLGNPSGPGGLSVPEGDPGGSAGGSKERKRVESKARKLEAKPEKADTTCDEPEQKPRPIELPQPKYSDAARAEGIQGAVRVQLSIDATGKVTAVKVLKSLHPELDEAAKQAVEAASFAPAMRCGAAVATTITISIKFSL